MKWTFDAVGPVTADIHLPAGRIEISNAVTRSDSTEGGEHAAGSAATIGVVLEPRGGKVRRAEELIAASEVRFDEGELVVHVPSNRPNGFFSNVKLLCQLWLPAGTTLSVKCASADIECQIPLDRFSCSTASGDVNLTDVSGEVELKTASGDLSCSSVGGALTVKGASGDVKVGRTGADVDIAMASGDLEIEDAAASVRFRSASGDVTIGRAHTGELRVNSASGDVVIGVARGVGARLDVSSLSGDVACDLPVGESAASEPALHIACTTVSGDVRIRSAA